MAVKIPSESTRTDFERYLLEAWHEAHGEDSGRISSSWGEDRLVVMIENALFRGERLLTQSEQGNAVLEEYVHELLAHVVDNHQESLANLLQREILSTSISVNTQESWVMFIFRLAE